MTGHSPPEANPRAGSVDLPKAPGAASERDSRAEPHGIRASISEWLLLARRWAELHMQRAALEVREQIYKVVLALALAILAISLMGIGLLLLDLALFYWVSRLINSQVWAAFLLGAVHLGGGYWMLRTVLSSLRGPDR